MDSPHAIGFYASSALALGGALVVVFAGRRGLRALALLISGAGVAGVYASLSAGFAALVVLASFAGSAAVGRLLFARDALAAEAVGALVLAALAGLTVAWRVHDRSR